MPRAEQSTFHRQVARVRWRLFLQSLLSSLVWAWLGALVLAIGWFLLQPYVLGEVPSWVRWSVLGSLTGLATVGAVVFAFLRRPTPVGAALSLDERFGLAERVTTVLSLEERDLASPAGQALVADVARRLTPVRVRDRFPVGVSWWAGLVPVAVGLLVLLAFFYNPLIRPAQTTAAEEPFEPPALVKAEIDQAMQKLRQAEMKEDREVKKSDELRNLEAELDKLARAPRDTKDQARERIKEMTALEDRIKRREQELVERQDAIKQEMQQLQEQIKKEDIQNKRKQVEDGPARDLDAALQQADFQRAEQEVEQLRKKMKAQEQADRLRKKLKEQGDQLPPQEKKELEEEIEKLQKKGLNKKEEQKLEEQLEQMEDQLQRLTRRQEEKHQKEEQELAKKEGELDRELDRLEKKQEENQQKQEELKREEEELKKKQDQLRKKKEEGEEDKDKKKEGEQNQDRLDRKQDQLKKKQDQLKKKQDQLNKEQQQQKQKQDQLKKQKEQVKQQQDQLAQKKEMKKDLEKLSKKMGECKKCMKQGNKKGDGSKKGQGGQQGEADRKAEAAKKLQQIKQQLQKMGQKGQAEQQQLNQKLQRLQKARQAMCRGMNPKGGIGKGLRPDGKEEKTGHVEVQTPTSTDPKGELEVIDFVPGKGIKGLRKQSEITEEVKKGPQAASEAINRQRLPRSASDMARGFFEKLRGSETKKTK